MKWLNGICVALLLLNGCSGQLYRVAPTPKVTAPSLSPSVLNERQTLAVAAHLLSGDELLEQFDANLLLAGIIVVDVRIANPTGAAQSLNLVLQDASGVPLKSLPPKKALQRVMKFYGNLLFAKAAYANTLAQYEGLALPPALLLEPQAERRGFLYFASATEATKLRGLRLTAAGTSIDLTLGNLN